MSLDSFRTANTLDAEEIALLVNKAYRPESGGSGWTHESDLVSGNRIGVSQLTEIMLKPYSVILLSVKNLEIVACVHIEKDGHSSIIGMLAVNPGLQGSGLGKQMLGLAECYGSTVFDAQKFVMFVISSRSELVDFYLRRGYKKTGDVFDYPLSAGAGIPKLAGLKIEVLEKPNELKFCNHI